MWLTSEEWLAVRLSLYVAGLSTLAGVGPAVALGWLLARRSFPGKTLLDAVVHLPLVVPPVVVGYLLLLVLGRRGLIGDWLYTRLGVQLAFTWWGAAIAAGIMGFPLMVRAVRLGVQLVDRRLEQAASTLGASPVRVFASVTLPLALPGVITGMILAFARSLGEFGATIVFVGNIPGQTRTLPLAMYTFIERPGGEAMAARLMVIAIALSLAALLASEIVSRRVSRRLGLR